MTYPTDLPLPEAFINGLPRRIRYGRGVSAELALELLRLGCSRPLLLTDAGVRGAGVVARVTEALERGGAVPTTFDRIQPEPPFACVSEAADAGRAAGGIDVVVALGGGSVMDTAKLVAATLNDPRPPAELVGIGKVKHRNLPLVCIPTTSGTGSEATAVAIFTDPVTGNKVGVVDPVLVPDVVLLDPSLTDGLPALPTAAAGIDALVHALEAYIARCATPIARGLALEAAGYLGSALAAVCRDGGDRAARDRMLVGANLAGIAFANSSCCAVHALALPLGGRFHIPHGVATGALVAETMRHNLPACAVPFRAFSAAAGFADPDPEKLPDQLLALASSIGIRKALARAHVDRQALPELARAAVANRRLMDPNPRPMTESEAVGIYLRTLDFDE